MGAKYVVLCGVPEQHCVGGKLGPTQSFYRGSKKCHASRVEAFRCYVRYLREQGYERVGPREFAAPNGGPVRVLTKKSRFGGLLRAGKENTRRMYKNAKGIVF